MCGRYTISTPVDALIRHLDLDAEEADALRALCFEPRWNLAPTEDGLIITGEGLAPAGSDRLDAGGRRDAGSGLDASGPSAPPVAGPAGGLVRLPAGDSPGGSAFGPVGGSGWQEASAAGARRPRRARWGLVPLWAESPHAVGARMINARQETLASKPAFRGAFAERRCLVPADGFYEWKKDPARKRKEPHRIALADGGPLCFAGLFERWRPRGDRSAPALISYTIITTAPNALVAPLHDRMPAILSPEHYARWLDTPAADARSLLPLLAPFPADRLVAYPVSPLVNKAGFDDPALIAPLVSAPPAGAPLAGSPSATPRQRELFG